MTGSRVYEIYNKYTWYYIRVKIIYFSPNNNDLVDGSNHHMLITIIIMKIMMKILVMIITIVIQLKILIITTIVAQ